MESGLFLAADSHLQSRIFKLLRSPRIRQPMQPVLEFLNNQWGLGGIGSLESILGLLKSLKIRDLAVR
jgi:hypothetical protein